MSRQVWKTTTEAAVDAKYEGAVRKGMRDSLWVLIPFSLALLSVIAADMVNVKDVEGTASTAFVTLLFLWLVWWGTAQRDVARAKYRTAATKLDAVLEAKDGRWEWCEDTGDWAVHFGDPHGENDSDEEK